MELLAMGAGRPPAKEGAGPGSRRSPGNRSRVRRRLWAAASLTRAQETLRLGPPCRRDCVV